MLVHVINGKRSIIMMQELTDASHSRTAVVMAALIDSIRSPNVNRYAIGKIPLTIKVLRHLRWTHIAICCSPSSWGCAIISNTKSRTNAGTTTIAKTRACHSFTAAAWAIRTIPNISILACNSVAIVSSRNALHRLSHIATHIFQPIWITIRNVASSLQKM